MDRLFKFNSQIKHIDELSQYTDKEIKNEPMLFNCSGYSAYCMGGKITREFIDKICKIVPEDKMVIDSRVHMLMPGWFPCIPGFHHDDVPRTGKNGQPNYINPEYKSDHIMALANGDICPTEFALGEITLPDVDGIYYKQWHPEVEKQIAEGKLQSKKLSGNPIVGFNWESFHQGTRAIKGGWRFFIRASYNTDRIKNLTHEIRRQVQVYLEHPMEGW